jgi:uncharacterized protein YjiS (DUF1127 family)
MTHTGKDDKDSKPDMWQVQHAAEKLVAGVHRGVRAAAVAVESWCREAALEKELQRLNDGDLADIGISRDQIAAVARSQEAPQLLRQMLQKLEIADEVLARHPGLREELGRICRTCGARDHCRRWLRQEQTDDSYRDFCPNESELAALKKGR